jgi:Cu/Zn superoxide dismutase
MIYHQMSSSQNSKVSIDTANLPNGVYVLHIYKNGQLSQTQQVVIVH